MDIAEALRNRKSIRAFKPDPVPREILTELLGLALRAPSWGNTQPWEFVIATGEELEEIRQVYVQQAQEQPETPDLPPPREFPEPYDARRRTVGRKLFDILGISAEDAEKRRQLHLQGLRLLEAPCVIYLMH